MAIYINNFGVGQKYGNEEGRSISDAGSFSDGGLTESISFEIALVDLTETEAVQNDKVIIPANYRLTGVELVVELASATGAGIDVGFIAADRNASNALYTADPNGLIDAVVAAELTPAGIKYVGWGTVANELPAFGSTGAWGAHLAGFLTPTPLLLTASRTTSTAFTAGKIRVITHWLAEPRNATLFRTGLSLATVQN